MTSIPYSAYYPNAAMSGAALREWAASVANFSSAWDESAERLLAQRTARWGGRVYEGEVIRLETGGPRG